MGILHYFDVVLRQERGKLCFIKRKDKVFLSDNRIVLEEKVWIFRVLPFLIKKVVDFLSKFPSLLVILPCFYFASLTLHFLPDYFRFVPPSFLDKPPSFSTYFPTSISNLPPFLGMQHIFLSCSFRLLLRYAYRRVYADTCSYIAHSASSKFLPSPFTFNHMKT